MREQKDSRIFFALWPDDAVREKIDSVVKQIPLESPVRRVPRYNWHLTLHFIGNVFADQLLCFSEQARKIRNTGFRLRIQSGGCFKKAKAGWLGCSEFPQPLLDLHRDLGQNLYHCGFQPEARQYNPHITIARKMKAMPEIPTFDSIDWVINRFVLVESKSGAEGVKYEVIDSYPLT